MRQLVSITVILAGLWLVFSGQMKPLLLTFGALSVALVVFLGHRMAVIDHESHPLHQAGSLIRYWGWLLLEIVTANLDVARRVLTPGRAISPRVVRLPIHQNTDLGRVIHANSITLTPGTVSLEVSDAYIEVHALTREGADALRAGGFDRRVPDSGEAR